MPLRAYAPVSPPCRLCGEGFEVMQAAGEAPLTTCPRCGQPVCPKAACALHVPKAARKPSTSEAKAAGFQVLKRTSDGSYERQ